MSKNDRKAAIILAIMYVFASRIIESEHLSKMIDEAMDIYHGNLGQPVFQKIAHLIEGIFDWCRNEEVEIDAIWALAFINSHAQEYLDQVKNPERERIWKNILQETDKGLTNAWDKFKELTEANEFVDHVNNQVNSMLSV